MEALFDSFIKLMERANFRRMTREDITAAVEGGASDWGVNMYVDFAVFERLTAEQILPPPAPASLEVHLGPVGSALEHIAQIIGKGNGADKASQIPSSVASVASSRSS